MFPKEPPVCLLWHQLNKSGASGDAGLRQAEHPSACLLVLNSGLVSASRAVLPVYLKNTPQGFSGGFLYALILAQGFVRGSKRNRRPDLCSHGPQNGKEEAGQTASQSHKQGDRVLWGRDSSAHHPPCTLSVPSLRTGGSLRSVAGAWHTGGAQ